LCFFLIVYSPVMKMKNFLVLAVVAFLSSPVIAETSFIYDTDPSFEFWQGGDEDRPKQKSQRAYLDWDSLKVCEPGLKCRTIRFDQLTWWSGFFIDSDVGSIGPHKVIQWTANISGFTDFYVGNSIPESC